MIQVSTFQGYVGVYGLGLSGMASVRALLAGGCKVLAWDDNIMRQKAARDAGAQVNDFSVLPDDLAAIVLSPGIALSHPAPHPIVVRAREAGIEILGDMELFNRALKNHIGIKAPIIAITGTNGKSTTTALTAHLLEAQGMDVQMGGNIGRPVLDLEMPQENTVYVLELSSYQIDLAPDFSADIAVLLNLSPDHIDRHGSFENYCQSKWKLFEALAQGAKAVLSQDDPLCVEYAQASAYALVAQTHFFSCDRSGDAEFYADKTTLYDAQGKLVNLAKISTLQGRHNIQNALAAFAAASQICDARAALAKAFATFPGLAHRMQPVRYFQGVDFINDSKGTNAEATRHALNTYQNIYWIAGGVAKASGVTPLINSLKSVQKAYLIGEAADDYAGVLAQYIPCAISKTLEKAIPHATSDALASGGGVVLFSPASASFDQFENFEQRGDTFCTVLDECLLRFEQEGVS